MDAVTYFDKIDKRIKVINLDMVKTLECKEIDEELRKINNNNDDSLGLYMDDILIHYFFKDEVEKVFQELLESDEKLKEVYDFCCEELISQDRVKKLMNKNGFITFSNYVKSNKITANNMFDSLKIRGVEFYLKFMNVDKYLINRNDVIFKIVSVGIFAYYVREFRDK